AELVEHQVAMRGGIQGSVDAPLHADRVEDAGEVADTGFLDALGASTVTAVLAPRAGECCVELAAD
ncbi:MAG: hypothetical protein ACRDF7_11435, partial [Candidatus Limnocylindrales bacterium]